MILAVPSKSTQEHIALLPPQVARSRASECQQMLLGQGSRMEIYPLVDELTVLRVPRRTEEQLILAHGSSGRRVLSDGHQVSQTTDSEIANLEAVTSYLGSFLADTTPFPDLDLAGNFRYYSIQRRVNVARDLRICVERIKPIKSQKSLERFLRDMKEMAEALHLMPDLAGKGNLVIDRQGLVKLIDINNFRRIIPAEEINPLFGDEHAIKDFAAGVKDFHALLPPDFLDDLGNPIYYLSLQSLHTLEVRGLGRNPKTLENDPFYEPLFDERLRMILALLRPDMA